MRPATAPAKPRPTANPIPAAAPLPILPGDGMYVLVAAAAFEEAEDEPDDTVVPVLVMELVAPDVLGVEVLCDEVTADLLVMVVVSRSARGRETRSLFCASG